MRLGGFSKASGDGLNIATDKLFQDRGMVFIQGERGSGRRFIARALHTNSNRNRFAFRSFNCSRCSPLEARRIFLGEFRVRKTAVQGDTESYLRYIGLLEEVGEGTLYLEEIDQVGTDMQKILAGVLSTGKFTPLGSSIQLDFRGRIIVSTRRPIGELLPSGAIDPGFFKLISDKSVFVGHTQSGPEVRSLETGASSEDVEN